MLEDSTIKLYQAIFRNMYTHVPKDPQHPNYLLGNTLINTNVLKRTLKSDSKVFLRVKRQGLPDRYRLFFRFHSAAPRSIIYIWMNSEKTQRKAGGKTRVTLDIEQQLLLQASALLLRLFRQHPPSLAP